MRRFVYAMLTSTALLGVVYPQVGWAQQPSGNQQSGNQPSANQQSSPKKLSASEKQELASLMKAGSAAYERGEFERSLRYFKDAYELYPHPNLLYRIALAYEKLGEDEEALSHYRQFLAERPKTKKRGRIEKTIEVIERRMAQQASQIRIKTDPSQAVVFINDEVNGVAGTTPLELPISPGNYKIIIKKEGYETIEEPVDVPAGQTLVLNYALKSTGPVDDASSEASFPTGPVVLAGFGVLCGLGTFYAYGEYRDNSDQIDRWDALKAQGAPRPDGYNQAHDNMQFYGVMTWVAGAAAIGSLAGATFWWLGDDAYAQADADAGAAYAVTPSVGADGATVELSVSY